MNAVRTPMVSVQSPNPTELSPKLHAVHCRLLGALGMQADDPDGPALLAHLKTQIDDSEKYGGMAVFSPLPEAVIEIANKAVPPDYQAPSKVPASLLGWVNIGSRNRRPIQIRDAFADKIRCANGTPLSQRIDLWKVFHWRRLRCGSLGCVRQISGCATSGKRIALTCTPGGGCVDRSVGSVCTRCLRAARRLPPLLG